MVEHYITKIEKIITDKILILENERYFLYIMGSIFLLGIITKWIVVLNYDKMIKKAENMDNPKNNTLRQIKLKFESINSVNGHVANSMLLVNRYINRCKYGLIHLDTINKITNWCALLCVTIGGISGYIFYIKGYGKTTAMSYILVGFYFALTLFIIEHSIKTGDRKTELIYIISDFFENSVNLRQQISKREMEIPTNELIYSGENISEDNKSTDESTKRRETEINGITKEQEKIINEVLGEYLQ